MKTVLWVAPSLNHYKARFLSLLAESDALDLQVLSGKGRTNAGDKDAQGAWKFTEVNIPVGRSRFGASPQVMLALWSKARTVDWLLVPAEKKNFPILLFAKLMTLFSLRLRLVTYNHAWIRSADNTHSSANKIISRLAFLLYDRIIFYTEQSMELAVAEGLLPRHKAYWASNTIDTTQIDKNYDFQSPPDFPVTIVFIGRLIKSKKLPRLLEYFSSLRARIPGLRLEIIGDGPESGLVQDFVRENQEDVIWHGSLISEDQIAPIMKRASLVLIPGHSGLSVNHALCYGRPYFTEHAPDHGPEIAYIEPNINGFIGGNNLMENVQLLTGVLTDFEALRSLCLGARRSSLNLSIAVWCRRIEEILNV